MLFMALAIVQSLLTVVSSTTFYVTVAKDGTCDYEPQFLTSVKTGDSINFEYATSADRVIESEQYQLCLTSNFDALTNTYPSVWTTTITSATPLRFYCTLPSHCPHSRKAFAVYPTESEAFLPQANERVFQGSGLGPQVLAPKLAFITRTSSISTQSPVSSSGVVMGS